MKNNDVLLMLFATLFFVFFFIGIGALTGYYECKSKALKQEIAYSFGLMQGCMVKKDGKWIDYDRLRVMD